MGDGGQTLAAHANAAEALTLPRRGLKGPFDRQVSRCLVHVELKASCLQTQGFVERITTPVTGSARAIRPFKLEVTDHCPGGARHRPARLEGPPARGTPQGVSTQFLLVRMLHDRLDHASGKRLTQLPDRLTDLRKGRGGLGQLRFDFIKPAVKSFMELMAQVLALPACTDVIEGDTLCSTSHGESSLIGESIHWSE
jgi:hypothetical protein